MIGFTSSNFYVNEDSGELSVCVEILQPTSSSDITTIPSTQSFRLHVASTDHTTSGENINFVHVILGSYQLPYWRVQLCIIAASDYTLLDTSVTLSRYSRRQCVRIRINHDYIYESTERFTINLSPTSAGLPSYVTLSPNSARVYIYNRYSMLWGV